MSDTRDALLEAMAKRRTRIAKSTSRSDYINARQKKQAATGRDIAAELNAIGYPKDANRWADCLTSLQKFCETYFAEVFYLRWSPDHLKVIKKIEDAVFKGAQFAVAMPRGSGKTSLMEAAVIWAILYGHRKFVVIIAANVAKACVILESIKITLETNEQLLEDFRNAIFPIWKLEHIHNRAAGQTYNGVPTRISWTGGKIVMPTIPQCIGSGSIISVTGLKGAGIRGQKHKTADGKNLRPDLSLIDDPQTTETAYSPMQNQRRYSLLAADVLGMAGPKRKISAVMCCTVIAQGDMADQILKHPDWHGERTKLLNVFPTNQKLWDEYAQLRTHDLLNGGYGAIATEFYRGRMANCGKPLNVDRGCPQCARRAECMDAGALVAWPERFNDDELSAVQHCINLLLRDEAAFYAEYQNEPKSALPEHTALKPDQVMLKANGLPRGVLPARTFKVADFVDVHDDILYYAVVAFSESAEEIHVADYGSFPDQGRLYFSLRDVRRTLRRRYQAAGKEGAILQGIADLGHELLSRTYKTVDGQPFEPGLILVDSGYFPELVEQALQVINRREQIRASVGRGITAKAKPFSEYDPRRNRATGLHWWIPKDSPRRLVHIDVNWWKSYVLEALRRPIGDRGSMTIYGRAHEHRMFADHCAAEYPERKMGMGRELDEWKQRQGTDNHLWDAVVNACAAGAMAGVAFGGVNARPAKARQQITLSEIQRSRKGA